MWAQTNTIKKKTFKFGHLSFLPDCIDCLLDIQGNVDKILHTIARPVLTFASLAK